MAPARTGFVIVSQSETLARGVCDVVAPMAPNVVLVPCGCHDEGLATAIKLLGQAVDRAVEQIGADAQVMLMADLGPARLAAQQVVTERGAGFALGHGPIVEGTAAGAVAAQQDEGLAAVGRVVASAVQFFDSDADAPASDKAAVEDPYRPRSVQVGHPDGLAAKPAALLARLASDFDAQITVEGVDATSVLALMGLGVKSGDYVRVEAEGPEARMALSALAKAIENGFARTQ